MSDILFLTIGFDMADDIFSVKETNIRKPEIKNIVQEFITTQIGAGIDESEPNMLDDYEIKIQLDLSCDRFSCESNCGNLGLRDGILASFIVNWRGV